MAYKDTAATGLRVMAIYEEVQANVDAEREINAIWMDFVDLFVHLHQALDNSRTVQVVFVLSPQATVVEQIERCFQLQQVH